MHLIGWLSLHHLVINFLELWSVLSIGPYFFVSVHPLHSKGQELRHSPGWGNQGRATHVAELWHCMWGRGLRGNNATCLALWQFLVTSSETHKQIVPFSCWFPGGWVCVHSRTLWFSPTNSPVRLEVSLAASTPTDFFSQKFWGFISQHWNPGLHSLSHSPVVPPSLSACVCGMAQSTSHCLAWSTSHCFAMCPLCPADRLHPSYQSGWMFLL